LLSNANLSRYDVGSEVRRLTKRPAATLHCMDDLSHSHAYATAGNVSKVAKTLKLDKHLRLHVKVGGREGHRG
jgi:hypothetical protein